MPIGDYVFALRATNSLYTNITDTRPFNVRVTPCETSIDFSQMVGSLEDKERVWYQAGLTYNIGALLSGVGQAPYNCGYDIVFEPVWRKASGVYDDLPAEVSWDPQQANFYLQKCYEAGILDDDCVDTPYSLTRNIVIITRLVDGNGVLMAQPSTFLEFDVDIIDACLLDQISFDTTVSTITYAIG